MKRTMLVLVAPPYAVCLYGCAGCCAAPVGVSWLAGMVSIVWGIAGGPANLPDPSWNTILLGCGLWAIASVWTAIAVRDSNNEQCAENSLFCNRITPNQADESAPVDQAH